MANIPALDEMRAHYGPQIDQASLRPYHYEGCWKDHWICGVSRLLDIADRLAHDDEKTSPDVPLASKTVDLPTWKQSEAAIERGDAAPLHAFIYEYEPVASPRARELIAKVLPNFSVRQDEQFRAMLAAVIASQFPAETGCARCKEHEMFRQQHRDCDKAGIALHRIKLGPPATMNNDEVAAWASSIAADALRHPAHETRAPIRPNQTMHDLLTAFGQAYHKLLVEGAQHAPAVDAAEAAIVARANSECPQCGGTGGFHMGICEHFGPSSEKTNGNETGSPT